MRKLLISMVANFLFWQNQANFLFDYKVRTMIIVIGKNNFAPTELDVSISAHNLTILTVILNFPQERYYLANKLEIVDFIKARGLVKFQSPQALALPFLAV